MSSLPLLRLQGIPVSLLLVVLRFEARRCCNLCFCVVDFFVGSPFLPSCFISLAADFLVFFVFGVG